MQFNRDERQGTAKAGKLPLCAAKYSGLAFLGTVLALILLVVIYIVTLPPPHYVLVLDSGSTGTRVYAYTWVERHQQLPLLTPVELGQAAGKVPRRQGGETRAYERVETEPGLAALADDPQGVKNGLLQPLLSWAEEVIPVKRHKETPIFLFATAGLRNLPEDQQNHLLGVVRKALNATPFRFQDSWARVVTGEREGIYSWIALNYLSGHLSPHPLTARLSQSQSTDTDGAFDALAEGNVISAANEDLKTVGSLDLGGSSLEVTFMPMRISEDTVTANVSILGIQYSLFTRTHQDHGLNAAFDRTVAILRDQPAKLSAQHASKQAWGDNHAGLASTKDRKSGNLDYSTGLQIAASKQQPKRVRSSDKDVRHTRRKQRTLQEESATSQGLLDREGRSLQAEGKSLELAHPCLHEGYRKLHVASQYLPNADSGPVMLVGRPDWKECERLVMLVVNGSQACEQPPCALGRAQPLTTQPMFALTGFYVVYHFFGLQPSATLEELESKGRRFCDTEWDAIASNRGNEVFVEHYCFRSQYVIKLLRQGLGLPEAQIQIGTGQEAWTLGAALAEGGRVGAGLDLQPATISRQTVFSVLGVIWLIWAAFVVYTLRMANKGHSIDRKPSGPVSGTLITAATTTARQPHHSLPAMPRNFSAHSLQGLRQQPTESPTAVIGGGDFNTNVARLSAFANQRKRVASVEDLQNLS